MKVEYCRFDRWHHDHPNASRWLLASGALLVAVGAWLIAMLPKFGGSIYGDGSEAVPYYLAYGQSALATLLGIVFLALGGIAARQRSVAHQSGSAISWQTARRGVRALSLVMTIIGALAVAVGLAVVIPDPTSADYWAFGIPIAVVAMGVGGWLWIASTSTDTPTSWNPDA